MQPNILDALKRVLNEQGLDANAENILRKIEEAHTLQPGQYNIDWTKIDPKKPIFGIIKQLVPQWTAEYVLYGTGPLADIRDSNA